MDIFNKIFNKCAQNCIIGHLHLYFCFVRFYSNAIMLKSMPSCSVDITNHATIMQKVKPKVKEVIKHPLENGWTLWYYVNDRNNTWERNLKKIYSFKTVEDFWCLYHHIKKPSDLRQGCDYSIFRQGVKPMWEDEANKRGGRWLINLDRRQRGIDLDVYWLELLLLLIGGTLSNSSHLCGVTVNIRGKGDKIGLWTSDANDNTAVMEVGQKIKEALKLLPNTMIGYQVHKDIMELALPAMNYAYTV